MFRVAYPLGRGIAAADHGEARAREQLAPAVQVQQCGWVGGFEERLRIIGIGEREDGMAIRRRPLEGGVDSG
jgi:hypothetical protein